MDVDVSILAHQKKSPKDVADLAAIVAHQNLDIDLHVEPSERQHAKRASVERSRAKQEQKRLKSYAAKMKLIELRHKDSLSEEEAKHMEQLEKEVKGVDTSSKGTSPQFVEELCQAVAAVKFDDGSPHPSWYDSCIDSRQSS